MSAVKVSPASLKDAFVQKIENSILSGELRTGDKLPTERELVKTFGVSLSVIAAGITELENTGFVEIRPRHGVYVADYIHSGSMDTLVAVMRYNEGKLSPREVISFIQTRIALEKLMVDLIIEQATDDGIRSLMRFSDTLRAEDGTDAIAETSADFFQELAALSGNILLPLMYNSFREPIIGLYRRFIVKNGPGDVIELPRRLLSLILARDVVGAEDCVENYLTRVVRGNTSILVD